MPGSSAIQQKKEIIFPAPCCLEKRKEYKNAPQNLGCILPEAVADVKRSHPQFQSPTLFLASPALSFPGTFCN